MAQRHFEGETLAIAYKRYRLSLPNEVLDKVLAFLEKRLTSPFQLAVDVGCGSGQGTMSLAQHFTSVLGTDVSPAQIELACAANQASNISYRLAPAEKLPLDDGTVDLVAALTAAHWFDRPRFLQEADRVLRPGGCMALVSYTLDMELEHGDHTTQMNQICEAFYAVLHPFRNAHIGHSSLEIYKQMYASIPYTDKEWTMSLKSYVAMVETFSAYQNLLRQDPPQARTLSQHVTERLMKVMNASSADEEVDVVLKYFYIQACKPEKP